MTTGFGLAVSRLVTQQTQEEEDVTMTPLHCSVRRQKRTEIANPTQNPTQRISSSRNAFMPSTAN